MRGVVEGELLHCIYIYICVPYTYTCIRYIAAGAHTKMWGVVEGELLHWGATYTHTYIYIMYGMCVYSCIWYIAADAHTEMGAHH